MTANGPFTPEQQSYLQGLAMGADVARKVTGLSIISNSGSTSVQVSTGGKLCAEETAKRTKNPLDMWDEIEARAHAGEFPKGTDVFLQKFHGLFYVAPAQNSYMCRLRFPGGAIKSYQLVGLADLADRYAGEYADVTTRANLQLREIGASDSIHVLTGLRDLGILNLGAGGDNIRNVTASPLSGIDPEELIETLPLARQMHHHILSHRELYGLPRKFNIAFDGGGRVSSLEDTNDIGFRAVRIAESDSSTASSSNVGFQLALGGITGHHDFATVSSVVVPPEQCVALATAIIQVFLAHGNRADRKKARLKYLLDDWGHTRFLDEVERIYGSALPRLPESRLSRPSGEDRTAHVGVHQQKQPDLYYVGVVLPVGRLTTNQMRGLAAIADHFGTSDLRLTVWQNLLLPNISGEDVEEVCRQIEQLGLHWQASNVRAGLVACTGNAGCKFAAANTKAHAMQLADYIEERIELDQPLNLHLTGCHHSCAQHYIGDLGFQATQVEEGDDLVEGYHIVIGGGWGDRQAIARELLQSVRFEDIPPLIVRLLQAYKNLRNSSDESFTQFANRWPIEALREMAAAPSLVSSDR